MTKTSEALPTSSRSAPIFLPSIFLSYRRVPLLACPAVPISDNKNMPHCKTVKHYEDLFAVRRTTLLDKPAVPPTRDLSIYDLPEDDEPSESEEEDG